MGHEPIVRCEGVAKIFEDGRGERNMVLRSVDLTQREGEFVVLIGPSGCGKSTLLNLVAGFDRPSAGSISVASQTVRRPGPDRAMVFQEYALLPWLDALGNVMIGLRLQGFSKEEQRRIGMRYLTLVGLDRFASRPVYKLSGGMQQRVSIARALALGPKVLLMDEPFGALDALQRSVLQEELIRIWEETNVSVLFVTHSLDEAVYLADRVLVMDVHGGNFVGEVQVGLPRPRDPLDAAFNALQRELRALLPTRPESELESQDAG